MNRRVSDAAFVVGGALLALSSLLHWVARGNGSTLRGHALIDTLTSLSHGRNRALAITLTVLWYAVPACGALAWIVVGFADVRGATGRATAAVAVVVTATVDAFFFTKVGNRAGPGVYVAALGAVTLTAAAVVPDLAHLSARSGTTGN